MGRRRRGASDNRRLRELLYAAYLAVDGPHESIARMPLPEHDTLAATAAAQYAQEWRDSVAGTLRTIDARTLVLETNLAVANTAIAALQQQPTVVRSWLSIGIAAAAGCCIPFLLAVFSALLTFGVAFLVTHLK